MPNRLSGSFVLPTNLAGMFSTTARPICDALNELDRPQSLLVVKRSLFRGRAARRRVGLHSFRCLWLPDGSVKTWKRRIQQQRPAVPRVRTLCTR